VLRPACEVCGDVGDAHPDVHAAAALDRVGGLLGVQEFPAPAGYARLLGWLGGFGTVCWPIMLVAGSPPSCHMIVAGDTPRG
jgi:hypothetical protein